MQIYQACRNEKIIHENDSNEGFGEIKDRRVSVLEVQLQGNILPHRKIMGRERLFDKDCQSYAIGGLRGA